MLATTRISFIICYFLKYAYIFFLFTNAADACQYIENRRKKNLNMQYTTQARKDAGSSLRVQLTTHSMKMRILEVEKSIHLGIY